MSNSEKRVDRYLFTFTRHYLNPIVSLSCLESHADLHVRLEMFADLYHLTLRNHPSSLDSFISRWRPLSHHSRPSMIPSLCASFFLYPVIPGSIFSLLLPGNSFAGRGSQANLRGTHHRVISSHPMACASFSSTGGRKTILVRDRYISMLDPTWICADQLSSAV